MIIPVSEKEKERLADAVFFMYDLLERIDEINENGKLHGVWVVIDDAIAHLKAIEEDMDW
jgi:hypothetical protein